jgi:hypothetical protein
VCAGGILVGDLWSGLVAKIAELVAVEDDLAASFPSADWKGRLVAAYKPPFIGV